MASAKANIGFLGAGALATSLAQALYQSGYSIHYVYSRTAERAAALADAVQARTWSTDLATLDPELEVLFLAIPDSAIPAFAETLRPYLARTYTTPPLVCHTAGSVPLSALAPLGERIGVFYPLQSFSAGKAVDWTQLPLFLESATSTERLDRIAADLGTQYYWLSSQERLRLHVGAVFAANYINHMMSIADELVPSTVAEGYRIYMPLLEEVVQKLHTLPPAAAQTGPAQRGDERTLAAHKTLLAGESPELQTLYQLLADRIQHQAGRDQDDS